jgi:general secretion pathway protein B
MSFILDALRKSEHERQRQTGPALAEVPVAAPKPRSNVWATGAIALLLVNLVAIGVLLIRKASREPAPTVPTTVPAAAPEPAQVAPAAAAPAQVTMTQTVPSGVVASPPPMLQPARSTGLPTDGAHNSLQDEMSEGPPTLDPQVLDPQMSADASAPPPGPPAVTRAPAGRGSVVYESLPASATVGAQQYADPPQARGGSQSAGSKLPTADEVTAAGGVPALNLDLHVYSTKPAERMVFVNSHKYREGDTLQEGPVVQQITPDGAILEFRGRKFLLSKD